MEKMIADLANRAGEIALKYYGQTTPDEKPDKSYVTEGDKRTEEFLREYLTKELPDDGIVGEEEGSTNPDAEYVWALDPIDGTTNYVSRLPHWGVCIGRLKRGVPVLGVVYLPVLDEMYVAGPDAPSTLNGKRISAASNVRWHHEELIGVGSKSFEKRPPKFPGKIRVIGSTVVKLLYVARGSYVGAAIPAVHVWDVAAGLPVLLGAGAECEWTDGGGDVGELNLSPGNRFETPAMIASAPGVMTRLRDALGGG
jgi:myo-inositol-1(or 4)-monophosphatase